MSRLTITLSEARTSKQTLADVAAPFGQQPRCSVPDLNDELKSIAVWPLLEELFCKLSKCLGGITTASILWIMDNVAQFVSMNARGRTIELAGAYKFAANIDGTRACVSIP